MNIIAWLQINAIRLTINDKENILKIKNGFYLPSDKFNSLRMFTDKETNRKIRKIVTDHRNSLSFTDKLKYILLRNTAFIVVDKDVQPLLSLNIVNAYAALALDAREVYVIRSEEFQQNTITDDLKKIAITTKSRYFDSPISKLP